MPLPRPPSADPLVALADQCVQCGLCLPACPTYRRERIEAESPRGRIALARGWALQALEPTPAGDAHLDGCLGCRSCEAVCPAGVRYGALLLEARMRQRQRRRPGLRQRTVEALLARPRLLALLLDVYRRLHPVLPAPVRRLPRPPAAAAPVAIPPVGTARVTAGPPASPATPVDRVAVFVGCAARAYERPTREALRRLLAACGIAMEIPRSQGCCGALHAHAGDAAAARSLADANARAFAAAPRVVTLATGCHEAVASALPPGAAAVDALDLLAAHADRLAFRPFDGRVALHLPCTQRNVVGSAPALRRLLAAVPGLEIVELDAGFGCCGASGSALLVDPGRADAYRRPLVDRIEAAGVRLVLSANLGCRLHLQNGTTATVVHPLEFLAARLDGAPEPRA